MSAAFLCLVAWSRQLAYSSNDATISFLQWFRRVHGFSAALPEVSSEAAGAATRRSMPLLHLPTPLESEVEEVLAERGLKPRDARRLGEELTERLKSLSHTPQRGGFGPPSSTKPLPPRGGRLRGTELLAAREAFERGQLLSMDDRAVNAALGLPPPLRVDERHAPQMEKLAPKYKTEPEILAYVMARLAPEYAVCRRVLDEAVRLLEATEALPGAAAVKWRPREALVYGAGVGAAVVAMLESFVASPSLVRLVALEPSHLRQMLGARVERTHRAKQEEQQQQQRQRQLENEEGLLAQQQQEQHHRGGGAPRSRAAVETAAEVEAAGGSESGPQDRRGRLGWQQPPAGPIVSWVQTLPPLTKAASAQRRRYDLVIAPYQLTVLPTVEERERLIRELWDRCGDVLLLVEPGTPRGFAAIAEARELVLGREGRKRAQLEAAAAATSGGSGPGSGSGSGQQHQLPSHGGGRGNDPRVANKLRSAGAHVVAPCPHDGTCPMQASKRHWCHFNQPLQLPSFMQRAMAPPGDKAHGRGRALNVQDERFSFVILRRGPRPNFRVAVSRDFGVAMSDGGAAGTSSPAAAPPPSRLPPRVVLNQIMLNRGAAAAAARVGAPAAAALTADRGVSPTPGTAIGDISKRPAVSRRTPLFSASHQTQRSSADASGCTATSPGDLTVTESDMQAAGTSEATTQLAMPGAAETPLTPPPLTRGGSSFGDAVGTGHTDGGAGDGGAYLGGATVASGGVPVISAFACRYPAFGPGLVGRLIALQDAGMEWATLGGKGIELDDAAEHEATQEVVGAGTIEAERDTGAVDYGGGDGGIDVGGSSLGLDAAVAELSMSMFGAAAAAAAAAGGGDAVPTTGQRSHNGNTLAADPTEDYAAAGKGFGAAAVGLRQEQDLDLNLHHAVATDSELLPPYDSQQPQQQLTRDDVTNKEYDRAELQLVDRIYGAAAARVWLANRYGHVDSTGTGASGTPGGGVAPSRLNTEDLDEDEEEQATGPAPSPSPSPGSTTGEQRVAEASSYGWGRLVRSPRLRGGHVILDLCVGPQHHYLDDGDDTEGAHATDSASAADAAIRTTDSVDGACAAGGASGASIKADLSQALSPVRPEGRLVQQVVAKSSRRGWMGAPAYRLARRLSWGDCWPDWYIRSHNTRETTAPRTTASSEGGEGGGGE